MLLFLHYYYLCSISFIDFFYFYYITYIITMQEEEAVDTCLNDNYSQGGLKHWNMGCYELIIKTSCDLTEGFPSCLITQGGSHSLTSKDNLFLHTKLHAPCYTYILHSKFFLNMATPTPASEFPSGEGP